MKKIDNFLFGKYLAAKCAIERFFKEEKGVANVIAIILVLVIVVALVIIFRNNIKELFDRIWGDVDKNVDSALGQY